MAEVHRAGVVAILGRPNAGKSTLLNRLLGEKLAIVTAKPQTTRSRILGIITLPDAQILLVDTPGMHASTKALNAALNHQVEEAADDCDLALVLVDSCRDWGEDHDQLVATLTARGCPYFVVGTKLDHKGAEAADWPPPGAADAVLAPRLSALTGDGVKGLIDEIKKRLPESAAYYPADEISDRSMRFLAGELVREAAFEELDQELPYSLAVEVVEYDESRSDLVSIRANLLIERESQKQIVIGSGGATIKRIGIRARKNIEKQVGSQVHLALWVKHEPGWSKRPNRLKTLGYR
jgi:GTP-binding protein Era